ncbi:SagB-type dehydrogenase domain-containing protein [Halobacillus alkaliphilus]|uniref:SagB-type dehydrogenase domain-containing protein n=1 Tax=Halobacillus alkaliphilus TaxID=396056 RepID=A0A1I2MZX4_9BACI|nr:SagB family peptide dehydrogenase [Halobacillus alkaliphilus]SFF96169.1 SagB-type dehydrogenase domain-containing protein [Halobacillus alkaliphilus]
MDLDLFLHQLHFQSDHVNPGDWEIDWEDAPLPFKIYRGLPEFPLPDKIPLSSKVEKAACKTNVPALGSFLWCSYGLTQFSQTALTAGGESVETIQSLRRFAPSGGGLYPNELYIYLKVEELPHGVYHYDPSHHRLLLLREGNFDVYLNAALGNRANLADGFGAIMISSMFWKNFFKYHNFSYRLQGLDAGALIGQMIEAEQSFHYHARVHFQFLDRAVNHLLGLDDREESIYAVIPLSRKEELPIQRGCGKKQSAEELCAELPALKTSYVQRSKNVKQFPQIIEINQSSMMESTGLFRLLEKGARKMENRPRVSLPEGEKLHTNKYEVFRNRHSPEMDFIPGKINAEKLAALFQHACTSFTCPTDLDEAGDIASRLSLFGCFYQVEGIGDGAYRYDHVSHSLIKLKAGDFRPELQAGMNMDYVNFQQIPICLHIAGDRSFYKKELGHRGYRIQHMEAGVLMQRLLLSASALGMNGHPLLGFDVNHCDSLYNLKTSDQTTLIQIPIGCHRPKSRLTGAMHL